jgi:hypothetical protein
VETGGAAAVKAEAESALVMRTIALSLRFCRDTIMDQISIQRALHLTSDCLYLSGSAAVAANVCIDVVTLWLAQPRGRIWLAVL